MLGSCQHRRMVSRMNRWLWHWERSGRMCSQILDGKIAAEMQAWCDRFKRHSATKRAWAVHSIHVGTLRGKYQKLDKSHLLLSIVTNNYVLYHVELHDLVCFVTFFIPLNALNPYNRKEFTKNLPSCRLGRNTEGALAWC